MEELLAGKGIDCPKRPVSALVLDASRMVLQAVSANLQIDLHELGADRLPCDEDELHGLLRAIVFRSLGIGEAQREPQAA